MVETLARNLGVPQNTALVYSQLLIDTMPQFGIDTPRRKAFFLAQLAHESANFTALSENLNYSAEGLRKIFGKYFPTLAEAQKYARKPIAIANKVYSNRLGNGSESSGEGWKYRGRGFIQLTGKANYQAAKDALCVDFVNEPDLASKPMYAVMIACWFWKKHDLNKSADANDLITNTKKINGGLNGLADRQAKLLKFSKVFGA